ncbi:MAG: hypothetical protein ABIB79_05040 [archaeon]
MDFELSDGDESWYYAYRIWDIIYNTNRAEEFLDSLRMPTQREDSLKSIMRESPYEGPMGFDDLDDY